jgi:hypothetical protein
VLRPGNREIVGEMEATEPATWLGTGIVQLQKVLRDHNLIRGEPFIDPATALGSPSW